MYMNQLAARQGLIRPPGSRCPRWLLQMAAPQAREMTGRRRCGSTGHTTMASNKIPREGPIIALRFSRATYTRRRVSPLVVRACGRMVEEEITALCLRDGGP